MKSLSAVALIGLFSIFACPSSTTADQITETTHSEISDLTDLEIPFDQAKDLCLKIHGSRIQTDHTYLWVPVQSPQQQSKIQDEKLTPGCFAAKYVACEGESRFPISTTCGFFTLIPTKQCSSTGNGRSRRSTSAQQKLTLSHGQATQLCASIENLPEDTPVEVNYIPIKINLVANKNSNHLSDLCISWATEPCADNEEKKTGCGAWKMQIQSTQQCIHYKEFYNIYNATQLARYPNPMTTKTDFVIGDAAQDVLAIGVDTMLSNSVKCTRDGSSVTCEIVKMGKLDRSKREVGQTSEILVSRVKRACCGLHRCGSCGLGRSIGARVECNCSNRNDNFCQEHFVCDTHEYPSGCWGNCWY